MHEYGRGEGPPASYRATAEDAASARRSTPKRSSGCGPDGPRRPTAPAQQLPSRNIIAGIRTQLMTSRFPLLETIKHLTSPDHNRLALGQELTPVPLLW